MRPAVERDADAGAASAAYVKFRLDEDIAAAKAAAAAKSAAAAAK